MRDLRPPLVSVIVTAHNYARFLKAAVESVFDQSYVDVECIVVDDGSSDETPQVLAELAKGHPALIALRNDVALGQGGASRVGFEASGGDYIVFLDGDDVLGRDFVRDHVFVNLSARVPVGFTSSDIYQMVNGRLVVATGEAVNRVFVKARAEPPKRFRPLEPAPDGPWPCEGPDPNLLRGVRYIPTWNADWCWSPMTANMFRRDALSLFIGFREFDEMRMGTDAFLCVGVNLICGSFLIDRSLSIYRIHGGNFGSSHAQLANVRAMKPHSETSLEAKALLIEHLTRNAPALCERLWSPGTLLNALLALDADLRRQRADSPLEACLARHREALVQALGKPRLARWLWRRRLTSPWLPGLRLTIGRSLGAAPRGRPGRWALAAR